MQLGDLDSAHALSPMPSALRGHVQFLYYTSPGVSWLDADSL